MADWGHLAENVAKLVDVMSAWLGYEYANWTADPDEVEEERRMRKRAKIKPPPAPLIRPVASRPESLQDVLVQDYVEQAMRYQPPNRDRGPRMVDIDEFDRLLELSM